MIKYLQHLTLREQLTVKQDNLDAFIRIYSESMDFPPLLA